MIQENLILLSAKVLYGLQAVLLAFPSGQRPKGSASALRNVKVNFVFLLALWCKMRFFRDMLHSDLQGEETSKQRGPVGLLTMLPNEFTREDVKALRIAQGMKSDPKDVISQWLKRGRVSCGESRGVYVKMTDDR